MNLATNATLNPLSETERTLLLHTLSGMSCKEMAQAVHLSPGTVRNYLSHIITRLRARNRFDAARIAQARAWI